MVSIFITKQEIHDSWLQRWDKNVAKHITKTQKYKYEIQATLFIYLFTKPVPPASEEIPLFGVKSRSWFLSPWAWQYDFSL